MATSNFVSPRLTTDPGALSSKLVGDSLVCGFVYACGSRTPGYVHEWVPGKRYKLDKHADDVHSPITARRITLYLYVCIYMFTRRFVMHIYGSTYRS